MKYLKAFSLGELLDRSIDLYREHFKFLVGVSFIAMLPVFVVTGLGGILAIVMSVGYKNVPLMITCSLALLIVGVIGIAAFLWGWGVQLLAVSSIILDEEQDLNRCLKGGLEYLPAILKATLLMLIPVLGAFIVYLWPLLIFRSPREMALLLITTGIALLFALYYYIFRLSMAGQAAVLEHKGPIASLRRSWYLVRGHWWRVFGVMMFANMLLQFCQIAFLLVFMFIPFLGSILSMITYPLFAPVVVISQCMIYYDLRIRKEAFDLQVLAGKLRLPASQTVLIG